MHSGPYLLPQIGEKLGRYCGEHLQTRGIEVRLNARVAALTAERAILDTGEVIETNTVVTKVGNATTHPVIKKLIDRYRLANAKGRVLTEPTLQVKGYQNLWTAGDCAAVLLSDGSMSPATAQFALWQHPIGQEPPGPQSQPPLRPFRFKALGEMASLGHLRGGRRPRVQSFGLVRLADVASHLLVQTAGLAA